MIFCVKITFAHGQLVLLMSGVFLSDDNEDVTATSEHQISLQID